MNKGDEDEDPAPKFLPTGAGPCGCVDPAQAPEGHGGASHHARLAAQLSWRDP